MKILSWNINGIRSVVKKGFLEILQREQPDALALQEIRADSIEPTVEWDIRTLWYEIFWNPSTVKKGYAGTAWLAKNPPLAASRGIGHDLDGEGRALAIEYDTCTLVSVYTPNAKEDLSRLALRQQWDAAFLEYLKALATKKPVVVCGDLNVAHMEIDLANPKPNRGKKGFTDEERAGFGAFLQNGFVDTFRHLHPDETGAYTWWSHFANSRARNVGWRIDYALVSDSLVSKLSDAFIRPDIHGSDHCPVGIVLEM